MKHQSPSNHSLIIFIALLAVAFAASTARADLEEVRRAIAEKGAQWTARENPVSRLSPEEMRVRLAGTILAHDPEEDFQYLAVQQRSLPADFTWRDHLGHDWITPVRDQSSCGSCWAFAGIGALEAIVRIRMDDPYLDIDLSEQFLVSCSPGSCSGGYAATAMTFLANTGAPDEECMQYEAANLPCSRACDDWDERKTRIVGWSYVPFDVESIKAALAEQPLNTTMVVYADFPYYESGVYEHVDDQIVGGHAVVLVGWEDENECWIVKNSWGGEWGEEGFFRIKWGDSLIGEYTGFQNYCLDRDMDGYPDAECGGDDCDDFDPSIHPCGAEVCGNDVDEDCIGGDRSCDYLHEVNPNDSPLQALDLGPVISSLTVKGSICRTGNDGFEYTGDVDYYRITAPAGGGLHGERASVVNMVLDWSGPGNLDLRLYDAADLTQIATSCGHRHPEAITNVSLTPGADYILLVAGQRGDPAEYELRICYGYCWDNDGDGFADSSCCGSDCDDTDPGRRPGAEEYLCDGVDEDCDDSTDGDSDEDMDGFDVCEPEDPGDTDGLPADCDDKKAVVSPESDEVCDAIDNDCDGEVDEGFDGDGDGFTFCSVPIDCDDEDVSRYPGAPELCNGADDDCDGEPSAAEFDLDGDRYVACSGWTGTPGLILGGGDCDETRADRYPGAMEIADLVDNDCDGEVDEESGSEPGPEDPVETQEGDGQGGDSGCGCAQFDGRTGPGAAAAASGLWILAPIALIVVLRRKL